METHKDSSVKVLDSLLYDFPGGKMCKLEMGSVFCSFNACIWEIKATEEPSFWTFTVASTFPLHLPLILANPLGSIKHKQDILAIQLGGTKHNHYTLAIHHKTT